MVSGINNFIELGFERAAGIGKRISPSVTTVVL
jgi:hypothetical protein